MTEQSATSGRIALDAYLAHAHACRECQHRLWRCPVGEALWTEYETVRSPSAHRRPA